jgi:hypothetical protein
MESMDSCTQIMVSVEIQLNGFLYLGMGPIKQSVS